MTWFWIILIILLGSIIALLCWAFKTAFMRSDIRLISFESGPLAKYKDVFKVSIEYLDSLKSERVYTTSFDGLRLAASYYSCNSKRSNA